MASPIYLYDRDTLQLTLDFSLDFLPEQHTPKDIRIEKKFLSKLFEYERMLDNLLWEIVETYRILGGYKALKLKQNINRVKLIVEDRNKEATIARGMFKEVSIIEEMGKLPRVEIVFDKLCHINPEVLNSIKTVGCIKHKVIMISIEDSNE